MGPAVPNLTIIEEKTELHFKMKFTFEECCISQTKPVYVLGRATGPLMTSI